MRTGTIVVVVICFIVLCVGIFWGSLYMRRYRYSLEKQAVKRSLQYTESKQAQLMQLVGEYYNADTEKQREYLLNRLELESSKIERRDVPEDVKTLLRRER